LHFIQTEGVSEGEIEMTNEIKEETVSQQINRIKIILGHIRKLGPAEKSYLKKLLNQTELKNV
jgi:hypothetical protein